MRLAIPVKIEIGVRVHEGTVREVDCRVLWSGEVKPVVDENAICTNRDLNACYHKGRRELADGTRRARVGSNDDEYAPLGWVSLLGKDGKENLVVEWRK